MGLLDGKVAAVSGVGPGLGQAIARALHREGASVVLAARSKDYLEELAEELGERTVAVPTDITDPDQCRALVEATVDGFGKLDSLINSAFRPDVFRRFEHVDLADWRAIFDVNVFGTLQLTQAALTPLKESQGSIVFVNSMVVRKPQPRQGGYGASKGALLVAAQALAAELGQYGIRVNSVVPGWMWGPPVQGYVTWMSQKRGISEQDVIDEIAGRAALGRIPTSEDCAEAVVFLASDLSRAMTGQTVDVNGGEFFS